MRALNAEDIDSSFTLTEVRMLRNGRFYIWAPRIVPKNKLVLIKSTISIPSFDLGSALPEETNVYPSNPSGAFMLLKYRNG